MKHSRHNRKGRLVALGDRLWNTSGCLEYDPIDYGTRTLSLVSSRFLDWVGATHGCYEGVQSFFNYPTSSSTQSVFLPTGGAANFHVQWFVCEGHFAD